MLVSLPSAYPAFCMSRNADCQSKPQNTSPCTLEYRQSQLRGGFDTCCEQCTEVSPQQPVQAWYNQEVVVVQEVVTQVGQLFLQPVASAAAPLLVQQASEDMSSGELMFSPLPGQERSQEAEAWQVNLLTHWYRACWHLCKTVNPQAHIISDNVRPPLPRG